MSDILTPSQIARMENSSCDPSDVRALFRSHDALAEQLRNRREFTAEQKEWAAHYLFEQRWHGKAHRDSDRDMQDLASFRSDIEAVIIALTRAREHKP